MPIKVGYEGGRTGNDWGAFIASLPIGFRVNTPGSWFYPGVHSLRGFSDSFEAVPTITLGLLTEARIIIDDSESQWQLQVGPADVNDLDGQVAPLDYNLAHNNVHWTKVGGL